MDLSIEHADILYVDGRPLTTKNGEAQLRRVLRDNRQFILNAIETIHQRILLSNPAAQRPSIWVMHLRDNSYSGLVPSALTAAATLARQQATGYGSIYRRQDLIPELQRFWDVAVHYNFYPEVRMAAFGGDLPRGLFLLVRDTPLVPPRR